MCYKQKFLGFFSPLLLPPHQRGAYYTTDGKLRPVIFFFSLGGSGEEEEEDELGVERYRVKEGVLWMLFFLQKDEKRESSSPRLVGVTSCSLSFRDATSNFPHLFLPEKKEREALDSIHAFLMVAPFSAAKEKSTSPWYKSTFHVVKATKISPLTTPFFYCNLLLLWHKNTYSNSSDFSLHFICWRCTVFFSCSSLQEFSSSLPISRLGLIPQRGHLLASPHL